VHLSLTGFHTRHTSHTPEFHADLVEALQTIESETGEAC
jgi:hypothetical protein